MCNGMVNLQKVLAAVEKRVQMAVERGF